MNRAAAFFATKTGTWTVFALTAALWAWSRYDVSSATMAISVLAIIIPQVILFRDAQRDRVATARDEAMHLKLDGLIAGADKVDDALQGIERAAEAAVAEAL